MKKIYIISYSGFSNIQNEPLCHSRKVVKELADIFMNTEFDVSVIVPKNYESFLSRLNVKKIYLKYHAIDARGFYYKVTNALKRILNFFLIYFKTESNSILYFVVSDIYLYFLVCLLPKKMFPRFIILTRHSSNVETFKQSCFNFLLKKADSKIDLYAISNKKLCSNTHKSIFIPDYFYNEKYYRQYIPRQKNDEIVCLGIMREYDKDLEGLVRLFSGGKYKLRIAGYFTELGLYEKLVDLAKDNSSIIIENKRLNDDEYYKYLGGAKYSIMPYKINMYRQRTSGVLLESVFMDTIPICHKSLLDFNNVAGISYERLEDLKEMDFENMADPAILKANNELRTRYGSAHIVNEFANAIGFSADG